MNGFFIDPVECGAEKKVELQSGKFATGHCDGILLPVGRPKVETKEGIYWPHELWVCSKCGREVK